MPFKADFARWVEAHIASDLDNEILSGNLHPVRVPAEFTAAVTSEGIEVILRFADSTNGEHLDFRTFPVDESCDCALILITTKPETPRWSFSVAFSSNKEDEILRFEDDSNGGEQRPKRIYIWRFKAIQHCAMVGWYDPKQLARTAVDVVVSTLFGRHADYRLMEALVTGAATDPYDYTRAWKPGPDHRDIPDPQGEPKKEIWLDYVGDVGDGWNSTYAVAHCLAQRELNVKHPDGSTCLTRRGEILVFGGDQVYPVADRKQYRERLTQPYEAALSQTPSPHPHAYAIPGNHDWYDSLVSFTRLFCQKRWFGGWQTNQSRSYFALKLPGRWWLLGTDVQLDSDIDVQQVNFFRGVANKMQLGDRVIICTAEPHWIYAAMYGKDDSNFNENNLAFLEKRVIGDNAKVVAFIAGDEHHYRRYAAPDGTQKITAGGGGAFLHPTHGLELQRLPGGYRFQKCFPEKRDSRKLTRKNFGFALINRQFGLLTASLYLLTAWAAKTDVGQYGIGQTWEAMSAAVATLQTPSAFFWVIAMVLGFAMFTDTHVKWYRWGAGLVHGASHLMATFFIGWGAGYFGRQQGWEFNSWRQLLFSGFVIFVLGWIVGSTIVGVYLYISLNVFHRHSNEAFSSLAIPDFKNFLRMRIEENGDLTIFPIGLRRVPRHWQRRQEGEDGPAYEPNDDSASAPELIDGPIYFKSSNDPEGNFSVTLSAERCLKVETTDENAA